MSDAKHYSVKKLRELLKDRRLTVISDRIDVSYGTLKKLADSDDTTNFETATLERVTDYLKKEFKPKS